MDDLERQRWDIDFDVAKSIRYHAYRRSFWEGIDRFSKIATVVSGAAVFVSIIGDNTELAKWCALFVAVMSALDVVIGFSNFAKLHDKLYRDFSLLAQRIAEVASPHEIHIIDWRRRRLEIEMDEPGIIDWLERRCAAEEARARGVMVRKEWMLPAWKIRLSQIAIWPSAPRAGPPSH
jgi:hypothetical protein